MTRRARAKSRSPRVWRIDRARHDEDFGRQFQSPLAEAIAAYLGEPLTGCHVRRFADIEIFVEIDENVRGEDVFIIQSTSYPANDNLMELLI